MSDFPNQVQGLQAPGVAGDFCDANPRSTVLAGPGGLIAGSGVIGGVAVPGAVVGRFGWLSYSAIDGDSAPAAVNTFGSGLPAGLVHRSQQGLITSYLAVAVQYYLQGYQMELFNNVGLWVTNAGASQALPGMKAFANFADGSVQFAAAGSNPSGASSTGVIAAATASATGSIVGNLMTLTAVGSGSIYPGETISSGAAAGTMVVSQLLPLRSGEVANGVGRYTVNIPEQNVAAGTALSFTYGVLTTSGSVTGAWGVGQNLSGTNVVAGTTITQQLTGTPGGVGTYVVNNNTAVSSTTIGGAVCIETKWFCRSPGLNGEIVKISPIV